jgi:hypothetical protein
MTTINSPVKFAKGLSDPIQDTRLSTMESLKAWMALNGGTHEFSSIELDQFWRGLQYSYWMCDKRPIQQQVAAESVLFIRTIRPEYILDWNRAFWLNIERIYQTLDKYRVPKFHLLIRIYLSEMINQMLHANFEEQFVGKMIDGFIQNVRKSTGAYIHVVSIFIDELVSVVGEDLEDKIQSSMIKIVKIGLHVIEHIDQFPLSVVTKSCETFLTHRYIIQYSDSIRSAVRGTIQSVAMDKKTDQDVRDVLYGFLETIDAIPNKTQRIKSKTNKKTDKSVSKTKGLIKKKAQTN